MATPELEWFSFSCSCGTVLRAHAGLSGKRCRCAKCAARLQVPTLPAKQIASPSLSAGLLCSVCQVEVNPADEQILCDRCGLPFHADCWEENQGCAAYGCANVGLLKGPPLRLEPAPNPLPHQPSGSIRSELLPVSGDFPWEYALLGVSVLSALIGPLFDGIPSALVAMYCCAYWKESQRRPDRLAMAGCLAICSLGFVISRLVGSS